MLCVCYILVLSALQAFPCRKEPEQQPCTAGCPEEVRASTPAQANFYHFLRGSLFVLTASGTQQGTGSGGSRRVCVGKESKADSTPHCRLHQATRSIAREQKPNYVHSSRLISECLITCTLCIEGSTLKHLSIRLYILNKYSVYRVNKKQWW